MQFHLKTMLLTLAAFIPLASAAVLAEKREEDSGDYSSPCRPLLQSCAVNSQCCGDLCVLGVRRIP